MDAREAATPWIGDDERAPTARTHMPKSTFIGLVFLIAALLVASVPALLVPTAAGVEKGLVSVGALPKPATSADAKQSGTTDKPSKPQLQLKGYEVQKGGDLRDTVDPLDREAGGQGRLERGSSRLLLDGQRPASDVPPASTEDGVLLDITGCPLLRPDTDVALLMANPDTANLYAEKVSAADDPAACTALFKQRVSEATAPQTAPPLGSATQRERDAIRRGGTSSMIIGLAQIQLLSTFMDDSELQDALAALDGTKANSATKTKTTAKTAAAT
jgi:hypothetical protein